MAERYFYYEPADYTACKRHMAQSLGEWFPETGENCKGSTWNYTGWDLDTLVSALKDSGELLPDHLSEVTDTDAECESLH